MAAPRTATPDASVTEVQGTSPRWWRWAPWLVVAGACGFGLVMLFPETTVVQPLNDEALHFQMVRWASQQISQGHVPLDGWYPFVNLGMPQFSHYQSLPHVLTAYLSSIFGSDTTERWAAYLLLALFPLSVYGGARLLGWRRWVAACSALVSPLLVSVTGYGFEQGSYVWLGHGLWPQEWGMVMLPLAWGLTSREVIGIGRGRYALAALALGVTIAMHFIVGYLAILSVGVFVIVVWRQLPRRIGRGLLVLAGAALTIAWVVLPFLAGSGFVSNSAFYQNTFWYDSYGAPQVLGWLFTGQIFDAGRFPIVSLLVLVGTVLCVVRSRRDPRARALLGLLLLSLVLFSGRPTFGFVLDLLPGMADVQLDRLIMGVHLAGDLLAGVGLAWLGGVLLRVARARVPRLRPRLLPMTAALIVAAVLVTLPAWLDRATYDQADASWIAAQAVSDQTDGASVDVLINDIKAAGDGRTYAGLPGNWGKDYEIGSVPVYTYLGDNDVDEVGNLLRIFSLTADNEAYFNERDPEQYQLYNIQYILMPAGMQPPVPAQLIASSGRHRLYHVQTTGYLQLVDTSGTITANRGNMAAQVQPYLRTPPFHQGLIPTIAFAGGEAAQPTQPYPAPALSSAGSSSDIVVEPQNGVFAGQVDANRPAAVMLKATYDPGWHVTVDGAEVTAYMVVPGFVAVTVGAGSHTVEFRYVSAYPYGLLLAIGLFTLFALALGPWLWRRRGSAVAVSAAGRARAAIALHPVRRGEGPLAGWHRGAEQQRSRRRRIGPTLAVFGGFTVLAVLCTVGLWVSPLTVISGEPGPGSFDPLNSAWFLNWTPFAVTHGLNPLTTDYVNYPLGVNLMWANTAPALGLLLWPATALGGSVLSSNVLTTASFALAASLAFVAIHRYVKSAVAACIGALVYAFSPFMAAQGVVHVQLIAFAATIPLALLLVDELLVKQRVRPWRLGLLIACLGILQFFILEEFVVTELVAALVLTALLALSFRREVRRRMAYVARALAVAVSLAAAVVAYPVALQLFGSARWVGAARDPSVWVTDLLNVVTPTSTQLIAPDWATSVTQQFSGNLAEWDGYLGVGLLILIVGSLVLWWRRPLVRVAGLFAGVMTLLSLGPYLHVGGTQLPIPLPWWIPAHLPLVENVEPSRLMVFVYLGTGLVVALAFEHLARAQRALPLAFAVAAIALVPLIPNVPLSTQPVSVPGYFTSSASREIPAGAVVFAVPCPCGFGPDALGWQIASDLRFKLIGESNVLVPSQPDQEYLDWVAYTIGYYGQALPPLDEAQRSAILGELRASDVSVVILGSVPSPTAVADMTRLLGFAPEQRDGVDIWFLPQT